MGKFSSVSFSQFQFPPSYFKICWFHLTLCGRFQLAFDRVGLLSLRCAHTCAQKPAWLLSRVASAALSDHCCVDTLDSGTATLEPRSHKAWLSASKHPSIQRHSTLPELSDLSQRPNVWVAALTMLVIVWQQWNTIWHTQVQSYRLIFTSVISQHAGMMYFSVSTEMYARK